MMDPEVLKALTEQLRVFNARASKEKKLLVAQGEKEPPSRSEKAEEPSRGSVKPLTEESPRGEGTEGPSEGGDVTEETPQELPAPPFLRRPRSMYFKVLATPQEKEKSASMPSVPEGPASASRDSLPGKGAPGSAVSILEDQWIEILEAFYTKSQEFEEARVGLEEAMEGLERFRQANGKRGDELVKVVEADFFDHAEGFEAYDQALNRRHRSRKVKEEEQKALEEAQRRNEERRQKNLEAERRKKEAWAAKQEAEFVRRKAEYWADYARRQARGAEKKARTAEIREERFREFPEMFKMSGCHPFERMPQVQSTQEMRKLEGVFATKRQ